MAEDDHEFISMVASDFIAEITTCVMLIVIGWLALGDPTKSPSIGGFLIVLGGVSIVVGLVIFLATRKKTKASPKAANEAAVQTAATVQTTTKTDKGADVGTAVGAVGTVGTSEGTKPAVKVVYKDPKDEDPLASSYGKKST